MAAVDKVIEQVLALSLEDQQKVFDVLASHHGPPGDPNLTEEEWNRSWTAELKRRLAKYEAGEAPGIPGDEAFARLRARYEKP